MVSFRGPSYTTGGFSGICVQLFLLWPLDQLLPVHAFWLTRFSGRKRLPSGVARAARRSRRERGRRATRGALTCCSRPRGKIRSLSDVAETLWDAGGIFACPDTDSFSARCQNREGHSPLAIHTAAFVHVLVLLAAGFALCFGESTNLT